MTTQILYEISRRGVDDLLRKWEHHHHVDIQVRHQVDPFANCGQQERRLLTKHSSRMRVKGDDHSNVIRCMSRVYHATDDPLVTAMHSIEDPNGGVRARGRTDFAQSVDDAHRSAFTSFFRIGPTRWRHKHLPRTPDAVVSIVGRQRQEVPIRSIDTGQCVIL